MISLRSGAHAGFLGVVSAARVRTCVLHTKQVVATGAATATSRAAAVMGSGPA